jgi:subfamily B ATP-binding cassette protein MsbA
MVKDVKKYISIYIKYIGRKVYIVFVLTIMASVAQGFGFTMLLPLLRLTQQGEQPKNLGTAERLLYDLLTWIGVANSVFGILFLIGLIFVSKGLLTFAQASYIGYLQARLLEELKLEIFDVYGEMEYEYYTSKNSGHFINIINTQVTRFFKSFNRFLRAITKSVSALSYFVFAFALSWKFTSLVVLIGSVVLILFQYLSKYARRLSRLISKEMSSLNKLLVQSIQSFKYLVGTNSQDRLRDKIVKSVKRLTHNIFRQRLAGALTKGVREPMSVIIVILVITLQVYIFNDPLAPIFVTLILFHKGLQESMSLQKRWQSAMELIGSVEMVDEEIDEVKNHRARSGTEGVPRLKDGIEFRSVYFSYKSSNKNVLENVNLKVGAKESIALVGESGAGKTTALDMVTLMLRPDKGKILIDDIDSGQVSRSSWRSKIGYVSQETVMFDDTVSANISLWKSESAENAEVQKNAIDAAKRAHANKFIEDLPNGYQTVVGDQGVRLSGGQRQRIFIARELFKRPDLLLLDEATSDLDSASELTIQRSINEIMGHVTIIVIAHRLSTVKNVDQIYLLENGKVAEKGTYKQLKRKENGKLKRMIEVQSL